MPSTLAIVPTVPRETARAARAVFGGSNFYIRLGEQMEYVLGDATLEHLAGIGRALKTAGAILPLVTFFEFVEGLTDEQAMDAFRARADWKFALHLPVHVPLFAEGALCAFRRKLAGDPTAQREYQTLVDRLIKLDPPIQHTTDEYETLAQIAAICSTNRFERVSQAMRQALEILAIGFPAQLRQIALPHWYGSYSSLAPGSMGKVSGKLQDLSTAGIGLDILHLLAEVDQLKNPSLGNLQEIVVLRQIWKQQFEQQHERRTDGLPDFSFYDCESCILKKGDMPGENSEC